MPATSVASRLRRGGKPVGAVTTLNSLRRAVRDAVAGGGADAVPQLCQALLALAAAQWRRGDIPHAQRAYRRAAKVAEEAGLADELAQAALGFGGPAPRPQFFDEQATLIEQALRLLPPQDSALRARLLGVLAVTSSMSRSATDRRAMVTQALTMVQRLDDRDARAAVLDAAHRACWEPEFLQERLRLADEILALARRQRDLKREILAYSLRFTDRAEAGDVHGVDADLLKFGERADELGHPVYEQPAVWFSTWWRATRALLEGRFGEVERLAERSLSLGERVQKDLARQNYGVQLFALRREQGRSAELVQAAAAIDPTARGAGWRIGIAALSVPTLQQRYAEFWHEPSWRVGYVVACCDGGLFDAAREMFDELAEHQFAATLQDSAWLASVALLAEVCVKLGDAGRARLLYYALLPFRDRYVVVGPASFYWGPVSRALGLLATAMEQGQVAEQHFEAAIQAAERIGAFPCRAHIEFELALALRHRGSVRDLERSTALISSAAELAERYGMARLRLLCRESTERVVEPASEAGRTSGDNRVTATVAALLDAMSDGIALIDANGAVLYLNEEAASHVHSGEVFTVRGRTLVLQPTLPQASWLGDALRQIVSDGAALCATVVPRRRQPGLRVLVSRLSIAGESKLGALILVRIVDPLADRGMCVDLVRRLYGLTAAEARLARFLCRGMTLSEAAAEAGIATSTARNQLKSIFEKTETSRQSDLLRLLLSSSAGWRMPFSEDGVGAMR